MKDNGLVKSGDIVEIDLRIAHKHYQSYYGTRAVWRHPEEGVERVTVRYIHPEGDAFVAGSSITKDYHRYVHNEAVVKIVGYDMTFSEAYRKALTDRDTTEKFIRYCNEMIAYTGDKPQMTDVKGLLEPVRKVLALRKLMAELELDSFSKPD